MLKFGLNNRDGADMKVLHMVAHLYANLVVTAPEFANKVLRETSMLHMLHYILSNDQINGSEPSFVNSVVNMLLHLAQSCFELIDEPTDPSFAKNQELAEIIIGVCHAVIRAEGTTSASKSVAFKAMNLLAETDNGIIDRMASRECMDSMMKQITQRNEFSDAIKCLSSFSVSSNESLVVWAFQGGFLPRALEILNSGTTLDRTNILFTLANITGSLNKEHIHDVMQESYLIQRILILTQHTDIQLKAEATWVITNAISCCEDITRAQFAKELGNELIYPLCNLLRDFAGKSANRSLLVELLGAIYQLLKLERAYPGDFSGEESISYLVE